MGKVLLVADVPDEAKLVGVLCERNGPPLYGVGHVEYRVATAADLAEGLGLSGDDLDIAAAACEPPGHKFGDAARRVRESEATDDPSAGKQVIEVGDLRRPRRTWRISS